MKDLAEQIHALTSCRVFKEGYATIPKWNEFSGDWDRDDEDGSDWSEEIEDEWSESESSDDPSDDGKPQPPI